MASSGRRYIMTVDDVFTEVDFESTPDGTLIYDETTKEMYVVAGGLLFTLTKVAV